MTPEKEFKVNEYITLKLESGESFIYIKGEKFLQCIRLVLNIGAKDITIYDQIDSIDEVADVYKRKTIEQNKIFQGLSVKPDSNQNHDITPEQEFWGHCSNLQTWVENDYDTRSLHSNLAFPLLKKLSEEGDPIAKEVFKKEIIKRFKSGYPAVVRVLL